MEIYINQMSVMECVLIEHYRPSYCFFLLDILFDILLLHYLHLISIINIIGHSYNYHYIVFDRI